MKLQPSKFTIGRKVVFGGCKISSKTDKMLINPGKEKTVIINPFEVPTCRKDIQSFLGFVTQMASWVPGLQVNLQGMRKLTSSRSNFIWTPDLQKEFDKVMEMKKMIPMTPLDLKRESHIHCDASKEGLGWVLSQLQKEKVKGEPVDMHDIRLKCGHCYVWKHNTN